ncbi:polysaccharide biosynthesis protein [alpha proteobacterium U9-1i]|nr:polysaccharide biosynthesis protein [alpha proteobacterium U9-1i]
MQIAQALIGLCAIAAFTRLMSPEQFGQYALALSASMLAHTLTFTWAESAAFRYYSAAKAEGRLGDHFATLIVIALALGTSAFLGTALALLSAGAGSDIAGIAAFAASAAVFRFLTRMARETDRAALHLERYAAREALYLILGFGAGVACLTLFDFGAAAPFAGLALAGLVVFAFDAPAFVNQARHGDSDLDRAQAYLSYGAPLALALAIDLGVQTVSRFVLAAQTSSAEVGAFAAAFGLARPIDLIFMAASAALAPLVLSAYEERGVEAARSVARTNVALLAALTLPMGVGLALVAKPLSALLVGEGLSASAAGALPWLALTGVFAGFNLHYWSEAFQLTRRTGLRALIMLGPGAVQVALTFVLAPTFGAAGAAMAAAASALLAMVFLVVLGRRLFALPIAASALARIALATMIMALAVWFTPNGLALRVVVGVFTYVAAALALDILGVRTAASAVSQTLVAKLRALVHFLFTDRSNARRAP